MRNRLRPATTRNHRLQRTFPESRTGCDRLALGNSLCGRCGRCGAFCGNGFSESRSAAAIMPSSGRCRASPVPSRRQLRARPVCRSSATAPGSMTALVTAAARAVQMCAADISTPDRRRAGISRTAEGGATRERSARHSRVLLDNPPGSAAPSQSATMKRSTPGASSRRCWKPGVRTSCRSRSTPSDPRARRRSRSS
jgi:hypothetical protein